MWMKKMVIGRENCIKRVPFFVGKPNNQIMALYDVVAEEVSVMDRFSPRVLTFLLCALSCGVSARAAERAVDLTAGDGTKLKASYFATAKPGPGVLLLH